MKSLTVILLLCLFTSGVARADDVRETAGSGPQLLSPDRRREILTQIEGLEDRAERLGAEVEIMQSRTRLLTRKTTLGFLDETYIKAAISILFPINSTFTTSKLSGYGGGGSAGVGHYLGRHHVLELQLALDLNCFVDARYRYEIHVSSPAVTLAPVLGFRYRVSAYALRSVFNPHPEIIKSSFFILGGMAGLALGGRTMAAVEVAYYTNGQSLIYFNTSFHFFL